MAVKGQRLNLVVIHDATELTMYVHFEIAALRLVVVSVTVVAPGYDVGMVADRFYQIDVSGGSECNHQLINPCARKASSKALVRRRSAIRALAIIKVPAVRNKRVRWLERDEAKRLIEECPEPLKSVVKFALATGLRRSNIINMEWQQIDMQRRVAWVNPEDSKSNRAIGVALNDTACKVLRDQIGKHHKWVFVHTKEGIRPDGSKTPTVRKMRVDDQRAWNAACRRAGIEDFRFHDLRHTWASWLIQSGVPLSVLQEMGGWESIEMVRRYAHLAPNHLTEHARQIDSIFSDDVPNMSHMENKEGIKEA